MTVNLVKGQKISLVKPGTAGLSKIMVGLGWDAVQQKRGLFAPKPRDIDCDASVILCGADGRVISHDANQCCVYFGNLRHSSGAIVHQGDNLTGEGEGDDEQIMVDLNGIPPEIDKLVFVVNIYDANVRNQHFGMIRNAFIRLVDMKAGTELCRFNLTDDYSGMTGMIVGEIYRRGGEWKFNAVGQGVANASRLNSLINMYK
ncbi:MAG: TerD family protein [Clostridia bacterium]|nr:TerD family protein [Clostridia bacterium]